MAVEAHRLVYLLRPIRKHLLAVRLIRKHLLADSLSLDPIIQLQTLERLLTTTIQQDRLKRRKHHLRYQRKKEHSFLGSVQMLLAILLTR